MERHEFRAFQASMKSAILSGKADQSLVDMLKESDGVPASGRIQIHHNNFRETLSGALTGIFPVLEAFVGTVFVKGALSEFCLSRPPSAASLLGYGADFAEFLDNHQASEQLPYIGDIVRLEWAVHELQLVDEVEVPVYASTWLGLSPNARVVGSEYPLLSLWSVANGQLPPEAVHLDQGGQTVVVLLSRGEVSLVALTGPEAEVLQQLGPDGSIEVNETSALQSLIEKQIFVSV